jgi:hypothetical protein
MLRNNVGRLAKLYGDLELPFSSDNLRAAFALGLCFLGHGPLHVLGENNVLDLNRRYLGAQGSVCRSMTFLISSLMLAVSERSWSRLKRPTNVAHSSLADLIDGIEDIFNDDHCLFRIGNMIVSDRCDID